MNKTQKVIIACCLLALLGAGLLELGLFWLGGMTIGIAIAGFIMAPIFTELP